MSDYVLVRSVVQSAAAEIEQQAGKLSGYAKSAEAAGRTLCIRNLTAAGIEAQIRAIAGQLEEHAKVTGAMSRVLLECTDRYQAAETRICSGAVVIPAVLSVTGSSGEIPPSGTNAGANGTMAGTDASAAGIGALVWNIESDSNSIHASTQYASWELSNPYLHGAAAIGEAEASAGWKLNLETVEGVPVPSLALSAGASVCALSAEIQGSIGNETIGASGSGKITAGSAEADGKIQASLLNDDGKLNPVLSASGSLEAIAAEAEGTLQGTLLGMQGSVHGGVNVGIGGHFTAGFEDGVFQWDVGASLGVGASVGASIDFGSIADTVCSSAEAVFNYFNEWGKTSE